MIPDDLRSLTVRQPHASAIVSGLKTVENRSWVFPFETPATIAIHAGLKDDPDWRTGRDRWPAKARFSPSPYSMFFEDLPHGVVLGVVTVVRCTSPLPAQLLGPWEIAGHWHWHLRDARPLRSPVVTRGRQGLLTLPADVIEQIRFQLDG